MAFSQENPFGRHRWLKDLRRSGNERVAGIAQGLDVVKVSVTDVRVEHEVKLMDFTNGNWIQEHHRIYRLADIPTAEPPDLMLWYLWSQNRQEVLEGTYSHGTALSLHELSDIMPSKLHISVPKHFRRNGRIPEVMVLHRTDLSESDIEQMQGVRVTRPLRTVLDLLQTGHVDRNLIRQAIDEAMRRGLITGKQIDSLLHDRLRDSFRGLHERSEYLACLLEASAPCCKFCLYAFKIAIDA